MKQKKIIQICLDTILAGTFLLWSVFYPDLYLVKDTCSVVECDDTKTDAFHGDEKSAEVTVTLEKLGNAKPGQIVIKSRFLEWLKEGKK